MVYLVCVLADRTERWATELRAYLRERDVAAFRGLVDRRGLARWTAEGVLNVYREVDMMLRELGAALETDGPGPRFKHLVRRLVPGAGGKNSDARYLRNYHASVFAPVSASSDVDDDDEDEDEGDEEDDGASEKARRALTIEIGSGIVLARATIYDRSVMTFEPNLIVTSLMNCQATPEVPPGTLLKVPRSRFKKIVRAVEGFRWIPDKDNTLRTQVPVQVVGKEKGKHMVRFGVPRAPERIPLFEITPDTISTIARRVREGWNGSAAPPAVS